MDLFKIYKNFLDFFILIFKLIYYVKFYFSVLKIFKDNFLNKLNFTKHHMT